MKGSERSNSLRQSRKPEEQNSWERRRFCLLTIALMGEPFMRASGFGCLKLDAYQRFLDGVTGGNFLGLAVMPVKEDYFRL